MKKGADAQLSKLIDRSAKPLETLEQLASLKKRLTLTNLKRMQTSEKGKLTSATAILKITSIIQALQHSKEKQLAEEYVEQAKLLVNDSINGNGQSDIGTSILHHIYGETNAMLHELQQYIAQEQFNIVKNRKKSKNKNDSFKLEDTSKYDDEISKIIAMINDLRKEIFTSIESSYQEIVSNKNKRISFKKPNSKPITKSITKLISTIQKDNDNSVSVVCNVLHRLTQNISEIDVALSLVDLTILQHDATPVGMQGKKTRRDKLKDAVKDYNESQRKLVDMVSDIDFEDGEKEKAVKNANEVVLNINESQQEKSSEQLQKLRNELNVHAENTLDKSSMSKSTKERELQKVEIAQKHTLDVSIQRRKTQQLLHEHNKYQQAANKYRDCYLNASEDCVFLITYDDENTLVDISLSRNFKNSTTKYSNTLALYALKTFDNDVKMNFNNTDELSAQQIICLQQQIKSYFPGLSDKEILEKGAKRYQKNLQRKIKLDLREPWIHDQIDNFCLGVLNKKINGKSISTHIDEYCRSVMIDDKDKTAENFLDTLVYEIDDVEFNMDDLVVSSAEKNIDSKVLQLWLKKNTIEALKLSITEKLNDNKSKLQNTFPKNLETLWSKHCKELSKKTAQKTIPSLSDNQKRLALVEKMLRKSNLVDLLEDDESTLGRFVYLCSSKLYADACEVICDLYSEKRSLQRSLSTSELDKLSNSASRKSTQRFLPVPRTHIRGHSNPLMAELNLKLNQRSTNGDESDNNNNNNLKN